jgi:hypothetical protein
MGGGSANKASMAAKLLAASKLEQVRKAGANNIYSPTATRHFLISYYCELLCRQN